MGRIANPPYGEERQGFDAASFVVYNVVGTGASAVVASAWGG
jgi:hypothetical protein